MNDLTIEELRRLCAAGSVLWSTHVLERLQERGILRKDVRNAIMTGEIIEHYPLDYPYPSCLVLGANIAGQWLHVVCGIGDGTIYIITAYYPTPDKFEADNRTRKGCL